MEKNIKNLGWYLIEKSYRGGSDRYSMRITKKIKNRFITWNELLEYIGDNTSGGGEDGYRIYQKYSKTKPNVKETLRFKMIAREILSVE